MQAAELLERDIAGIVAAVKHQTCTASALLEAQLAVIDAREPDHHAYIADLRDQAAAQAAAIDAAINRGEELGPLAGVPIAIKDIFDVAGVATTAGMSIHRNNLATADATVVRRLREAGAVLLGKLTLTEGVYAEHRPPFAAPVNPWHPDYWSGASSSGSGVALAAGLCRAALGSETGGSIKLPAAANGVTALKPTWGRVSRHGVFELAATLDHVGPFARSAADAALILGAIAGADANDPTAAPLPVPDYATALQDGIAGVRIGTDPAWIAQSTDAETRGALATALEVLAGCGAELADVDVPDVNDMIWDWFPVCAAQTALAHADTFPSRRAEYGPALEQLLDMGRKLSATDYQQVLLRREEFRGRLAAMFTRVDLLAIPVLAFPVPSLERMQAIDDELIAGLHRFTCPFNMSGSPGLVLPCGLNQDGLPLVFQLVGKHYAEDLLLAAGAAYQQQTDWHKRRPAPLATR